jgi:hypothetical protein
MEDLKTKEEILSEYFLVETEKTDEMKGWKVVGTIEGCTGQSVSPILELKTDGDGWLCDFKIKLLGCGLVLTSPEYVIDDDELVMEAMEKVWSAWGIAQTLQEVLNQQVHKILEENTRTEPYYPHDSWNYPADGGTWTTTTSPIINPGYSTWTNTITCSDDATSAANYIPAMDYLNGTTATTAYYDSACSTTCSC